MLRKGTVYLQRILPSDQRDLRGTTNIDFLAEVTDHADEAAEGGRFTFSVFFRVICGICERKGMPEFLAEDAEDADETAEGDGLLSAYSSV